MKRLKSLTILPILLLASLTACNNNGLSWKSGDKVYYDRIIFDTSDEKAPNPHILLGVNAKVASVKLGRDEIKFGYSGKVLTLSKMERKRQLISLTQQSSSKLRKISKVLVRIRKLAKDITSWRMISIVHQLITLNQSVNISKKPIQQTSISMAF